MSRALRILIAEDEVPIAMGLARQLELLGHHVVAQASDGRQAVEMAAEQAVDLAVLDIRMPELDGIDAARQINEHRPTPVIMLTAHCEDDLIARAAAAGVYAYLAKPVRPDELRSAIAIALGRFRDHAEMVEEIEQLKLTLKERKTIERAKGVIMRRLGLTEEQAYQRLRKESQNTRKPMAQIAQAVIEAESLLLQKQPADDDAEAQGPPGQTDLEEVLSGPASEAADPDLGPQDRDASPEAPDEPQPGEA